MKFQNFSGREKKEKKRRKQNVTGDLIIYELFNYVM